MTRIRVYLPGHFAETRPDRLHAFIRRHPLGTLVVAGEGGLAADHIPCLLHMEEGGQGHLRAHIARANPLAGKIGAGLDCLVVFHGPQHYISPNWYATKAADSRVVPTWNYEAVHVSGRLTLVDDAAWLRNFLDELTGEHESSQPRPWRPDDAPPDYLERMLRAIVGIRVDITGMVGKAKLSQNQPEANRKSVVAALAAGGGEAAKRMAEDIQSGMGTDT
jgi:transcriptional regulator